MGMAGVKIRLFKAKTAKTESTFKRKMSTTVYHTNLTTKKLVKIQPNNNVTVLAWQELSDLVRFLSAALYDLGKSRFAGRLLNTQHENKISWQIR